ncbi:MAG: methyltransferase domain-containing protein [Candidatus Binatia bacterium]
MRRRVLDFLCCPDCRHETLDLTVYKSEEEGDNETVVEGEICCQGCGSRFPVINSIPRMLPQALRPSLVGFHRDFFQRYPDLVPQHIKKSPNEQVARTLAGYSYQHVQLDDRAREVERWRRSFCESIPVQPDFFRGKVGADIGCGEGRFLYWAHEFGAEMVGVDLSEGVEVAQANTAACSRCQVVQGDIYHLPFKPGVFDFAYSIGVLHHLPNPREGFRRVIPAVKLLGGKVFIWVYGLQGMRWWYRLSHMTWLRGIAPYLPRWAQHLASMGVAGVLELAIWWPCRIIALFPGGESLTNRLPLGDAYRRSFRAKTRSVLDRFQPPETHYHTAEELTDWFKEAGLMNVSVINRDGRGWLAIGDKGQEHGVLHAKDVYQDGGVRAYHRGVETDVRRGLRSSG